VWGKNVRLSERWQRRDGICDGDEAGIIGR
jgi:hypothetical protein